MKMFWTQIVVMAVELHKYTELHLLKGKILWYVNYLSIKLMLKNLFK